MLATSVLAGCGSSGGLTLSAPVRTPSGYATFHGPWFTVILPNGWPASVTREAAHTALMSVFAPGAAAGSTQGAATTLKLPRVDVETMTAAASSSRPVFNRALASLGSGASFPVPNGSVLRGKATVTTVHLAGATEAKLINTTGTTLPVRAMTLLVLAPAGATSVGVTWTGRATLLNPTAIIHSFRLTGSSSS